MTITKYGHCCLLIEIDGKRILTDPGKFSVGFELLTNIDIILITHEHTDHFHSDSVIHILDTNPDAVVVTNTSVAKLLQELSITATILEGREASVCAGVPLQAFDGEHAEIYKSYGQVQNTGYLVNEEFFYPGDAYTIPGVPVKVLALPVAGPWCKVSEALTYALAVHPDVAIPVHDAVLSDDGKNVVYAFFTHMLTEAEIAFMPLSPEISEEL